MKKILAVTHGKIDLSKLAEKLPADCNIVEQDDLDEAFRHLDDQDVVGVVAQGAEGLRELSREAEARRTPDSVDPARLLSAINEGIVVIDRNHRVVWCNREFERWGWKLENIIGAHCFELFHNRRDLCVDCEGEEVFNTRKKVVRIRKGEDGRYYETTTSPVFDDSGDVYQIVKITRDVTDKIGLEEKLETIYTAGRELTGLDPEAMRHMTTPERTQMIRRNVIRFTKSVMQADAFVIRQIDEGSKQLKPIIIESPDPEQAMKLEVRCEEHNSGISGYVAFTGKSYLCRDGERDPLFVPETPGGQSSITVPLRLGESVIGTFHMESPRASAFNYNDLKFLEIFADYVAIALNTARLLRYEYNNAFGKVAQTMAEEIAEPLQGVMNTTHRLMAEYVGHDEATSSKLKGMERNIEKIQEILKRVSRETPVETKPPAPVTGEADVFRDKRILVADDDPAIRESLSLILGKYGCTVEVASDGQEAIDLVKTGHKYDLVISDIKMPKKNGYEVFAGIRDIDPDVPIILMTAFGYDPNHTILKSRQEGLEIVLFKPFRVNVLKRQLRKALQQKAGS